MLDTGGPPHYITTDSTVPLIAQLMHAVDNFSHSVLSLLFYVASLFIQIFYIIDSGLFWDSLGNN